MRSGMIKLFAVSLALTWLTGYCQAGFITFAGDSAGTKPNGFQSVESSLVTFSDTVGADLVISDFGSQSLGQGLAVFADDNSGVLLSFLSPQTSLSMVFGNDDSGFTQAGDVALLTLFDGVTQVGQVSVVLNRNDLADQSIAFSGPAFTSATFFYASGTTPINLLEIIDDVQFDGAPSVATPLPPTLLAGFLGMTMLAGVRRLRRA